MRMGRLPIYSQYTALVTHRPTNRVITPTESYYHSTTASMVSVKQQEGCGVVIIKTASAVDSIVLFGCGRPALTWLLQGTKTSCRLQCNARTQQGIIWRSTHPPVHLMMDGILISCCYSMYVVSIVFMCLSHQHFQSSQFLSLLSTQFFEVVMSEANYATYRYNIDILIHF